MKVAEEIIDLIQDTPPTKTYKPKKTREGKKNLADVLLTRPKKEKTRTNMAHFQTDLPKNYKHQCDTLYLPTDTETRIKYKYALVVVDVGTLSPINRGTLKTDSYILQTLLSRRPRRAVRDS
jgi:hypothetical protein